MIGTGKTSKVSPHIEKRSQSMVVERLDATTFRIIPSEPGKRNRIVKFHYDESDADAGIECFEQSTGVGCPANDHGMLCAHIHRAIEELLRQNEE